MNERVVKLARRAARANGVQQADVPRETRRAWARLPHKERGRWTTRWSRIVMVARLERELGVTNTDH